MRRNKFASSYYHLGFSHLYKVNTIFFNNWRLQNFSLSSFYFDNATDKLQKEVLEKIKPPKSVSKSYNQLSKVEEKDIEIVESLKEGNIFYPYKSAEDRAKSILAESFKITYRKLVKTVTGLTLGNLEFKTFLRHTDILIVGGGGVGLSIAHAIKSKFPFGPHVTVVDKDASFPHLTTNIGQGIVTFQKFINEEEIELLKYGAEFFSSFSRITEIEGKPPFKLPFEPLGSLVLVDNSNVEQTFHKLDLMNKYGIQSTILNIETIKNKFPWLNVDDVLFGHLAMPNEGMIDPWSFLLGLRYKCVSLGVNFVTAEVIDFGVQNGGIKRIICKLPDGTYNSIDFGLCILANGLECKNLVNVLNNLDLFNLSIKLPLEERMQYEYCFYNPKGPGMNTPTVMNPDKIYFRREGLLNHYVAGISSIINEEDENQPYQVFNNKIKPFLLKRISNFNEVNLVKIWIDAHEFCISNETGIAGPHPEIKNIYFALGFSHVGFQYLPAVGRAVMEYLLCGGYKTIDFEMFHIENLWRKQHLEAERKERELLEAQQRHVLTQ